MFRSGIAFTDLTVNSACDDLFPGVEDVDAQATLQLRAALDAFEEGVFEFHNRAAAPATGASPAESGNKARRRTRREQAYASRIPEDRQFFRPVEVQSAEWAAFKPHLWLRGRQAAMHTPPPPASAAAAAAAAAVGSPASGKAASAAAAKSNSPAAAAAAAAAATTTAASSPNGQPAAAPPGDLLVRGSKMRLAPPQQGLDLTQEEVLASDGEYEETFVVQHDEWEAHVPPNLRRRRGRPRDEKAVAIGLPPVEPKNAVLYDIAETLLPELWSRLAPLLAPLLGRLATERREQPGGGRGASAFRAGGGGGRPGGGGGGEFEIITFSSGEEEAISGEILVGGSDLGLGLGQGPRHDVNDDDGDWPYGGGGHDRFTAAAAAAAARPGPGSLCSGGAGSILECESYDSDGELYRALGGGPPESPLAGAKLIPAPPPDGPVTVTVTAAATVGGGGGRTPPPGPPPVLPRDRDLLPPDAVLAPALARGPPLQRPPVAPPPVGGGAAPPAALSPLTSPSQSHSHSRSPSLTQASVRFSYSGEGAAAAGATLAPLAPPLAPLQVPPNNNGSPRTASTSPGAQPLPPGPLYLVAQQLLGGGTAVPHPHPHTPAAPAAPPPAEAFALLAPSSHPLALQHPHFHHSQQPQLQAQQQHQQPQAVHPALGLVPRRVPSLSLMSVPPPYANASTNASPQSSTASSGWLEVSGMVVPGNGGGGGGVARGPSLTASGGGGSKGPRAGGAGGGVSFGGPSSAALPSPVAVLSQHSRFLAAPGSGAALGAAPGAGGGGGSGPAGSSPARTRHASVAVGPAAPPPGPVAPAAVLAAAAAAVGTPGGVAGAASRGRHQTAAGAVAGAAGGAGGGGHHSVHLAPLTSAPAPATAGLGAAAGVAAQLRQQASHPLPPPGMSSLSFRSAAGVGGAPQAPAGAVGGSAVLLSRGLSGDLALAGGRSAASLPGYAEAPCLPVPGPHGGGGAAAAVQQQQSPPPPQQQSSWRSNGARTSPLRKGSSQGQMMHVQASAAAAPGPTAGSQHPQPGSGSGSGSGGGAGPGAAAAAGAAAGGGGGGGGGGAAGVAGSAAGTRLPALSLSRSVHNAGGASGSA